ncbi:MAG: hypothetical protein Q8P60_15790 [Pseudorhodobacter sp.]|nr:hypothetical protein [Pseudorhodobacter sp.]
MAVGDDLDGRLKNPSVSGRHYIKVVAFPGLVNPHPEFVRDYLGGLDAVRG